MVLQCLLLVCRPDRFRTCILAHTKDVVEIRLERRLTWDIRGAAIFGHGEEKREIKIKSSQNQKMNVIPVIVPNKDLRELNEGVDAMCCLSVRDFDASRGREKGTVPSSPK